MQQKTLDNQNSLNQKYAKYSHYIKTLITIAKQRRLLSPGSLENLASFMEELRKNLKNQTNPQLPLFSELLAEFKKRYKNNEISELLLRLASFYYSQEKKDFATAAHAILNKLIYPHSNYTNEQVSQVELVEKLVHARLNNFKDKKDFLQNLLTDLVTDKPIETLLQSYLINISAIELFSLLPNGIYACNHIYYSTLTKLFSILETHEDDLNNEQASNLIICENEEVTQENIHILARKRKGESFADNIDKLIINKETNVNDDSHTHRNKIRLEKLSASELQDFAMKALDSSSVVSVLSELSNKDREIFGDVILTLSEQKNLLSLYILPFLPESSRVNFVAKHQAMIKKGYHVIEILTYLPLSVRLSFVKYFSKLITFTCCDIIDAINKLHPSEMLPCIMICSASIIDSSKLVWFIPYLLTDNDVLSLIMQKAEVITKSEDLLKIIHAVHKSMRLIIIKEFKSVITNTNELMKFLELLSDFHRVDLLNNFGHLIKRFGNLVKLLKLLPETERLAFVNKHGVHLRFSFHLLDVLTYLPSDAQAIFINEYQHLIKDENDLASVLNYLPETERYTFANSRKEMIRSSIGLRKILDCLPKTMRGDFAMQANIEINNTFSLLKVLGSLPTNGFDFAMKYQNIIRTKEAANFDTCLSPEDRKLIGPRYQKAETMFTYIMEHLNDTDQKKFANEFKQTNETAFLFKMAFPEGKTIDFSIPFYRSVNSKDGKIIHGNPTCTIELESGHTFEFRNNIF